MTRKWSGSKLLRGNNEAKCKGGEVEESRISLLYRKELIEEMDNRKYYETNEIKYDNSIIIEDTQYSIGNIFKNICMVSGLINQLWTRFLLENESIWACDLYLF